MPIWVWGFLSVAGVLFLVKLLYLAATGGVLKVTEGALFVPTARRRIEAFLDALPMCPDDLMVDLGCGDGRVLRAAQKRYGIAALGIEVNPFAYLAARIRNLGNPRVRIRWKDFRKVDLGDADVVFCYLFPDVLRSLRKKLESELKTGARVVSCNFPFPGWRPMEVVRPESDTHGDPIYLYRFPDCRASLLPGNPSQPPLGLSGGAGGRIKGKKARSSGIDFGVTEH